MYLKLSKNLNRKIRSDLKLSFLLRILKKIEKTNFDSLELKCPTRSRR